jgi:hypothetical protein
VLLNNDVVVTDGWLDQLIGLVNAKRGTTAEHAEGAERKASAEGRLRSNQVRGRETRAQPILLGPAHCLAPAL